MVFARQSKTAHKQVNCQKYVAVARSGLAWPNSTGTSFSCSLLTLFGSVSAGAEYRVAYEFVDQTTGIQCMG